MKLRNAIVWKLALLVLSVMAVLLGGCEDKIQVDLKNTEPRLVIEGYLAYSYNESYFKVSRTTDFYKPNKADGVSGALIIIADEAGQADTMFELAYPKGSYYFRRIRAGFRGRYQATVTVEGKTYVASTTMPLPTKIDSVRMRLQEGDGFGPEENRGYRVHVFFRDRAGVPDYARIKLWKNGGLYPDFYLYNGKFSDGHVIDYDYFFGVYQIGEIVEVELVAMDRTMFDYFQTLTEVAVGDDGGGSFDATPANPNTNWSGGALGYFGAFYLDFERLVVKE